METARRLLYTPFRDLIRLRVSGRLDWKKRIAQADLPNPARDLIRRVARRTRLWRLEKASIADELIAHFRDAMEAGISVESAIESFGNEKQAARLIRRAKIRNRPLIWHAFRWLRRFVGLLIILHFTILAPIFFCTHPVISVDYLAQMNRPILAVPESDRAWPLYRKAIYAMLYESAGKESDPEWFQYIIDGKHWPDAQAWVRLHSADIEIIRQGAQKPTLGFVLGRNGSVNDPLLWPPQSPIEDGIDREIRNSVLAIQIPYIQQMRDLALILEADAKAAQIDHDGDRIGRDVVALLQMATQLRNNDPFLISQLVEIGIDDTAVKALGRALAADPAILSDRQLIELAHELSIPQTGADLIDVRGEKIFFHDTVQRIYSDDGNGDGHLTADGVRYFAIMSKVVGGYHSYEDNWSAQAAQMALAPAGLLVSASRKELLEQYDRAMDTAQANLRLPLRNSDLGWDRRFMDELGESMRLKLKYALIRVLLPSLGYMGRGPERYLGHRDGLVAAIALELYHRRHNTYPQKLDELVPAFLPTVPADRVTGDPIKFRIVDGLPLLYSVGDDRTDDGGAVNADPTWASEGNVRHGDWILYPIPAPPEEDK